MARPPEAIRSAPSPRRRAACRATCPSRTRSATARCGPRSRARRCSSPAPRRESARRLAIRVGVNGARVLLVSRTREKLEAVQAKIEEVGGEAHVHPCDLTDTDAIGAMAEEVLAEHGGVDILDEQRRDVDPALGRQLVRPPPRLRADDPAQLPGRGRPDPQGAARHARAPFGPHREHLVDGRADQHAPLLGLRRVEERARRLLALDRLRGHRRRRATSPPSTCRWSARR